MKLAVGLATRRRQAVSAMWAEVRAELEARLQRDHEVRELVPGLEAMVADAEISPAAAARTLLDAFAAEDETALGSG
jgi:LAO/AO transport system kinase